jgi:hypothetical protein
MNTTMTDFKEGTAETIIGHTSPPDKSEHRENIILGLREGCRKKNHTKELIQSRERLGEK